VAAGCAWRGWRPLGAALVPAALLLSLATVYCQFHYAVDALAGIALAAAVLVGGRLARYHSPRSTPGRSEAHGDPS
jgi:membrane-associated phospholipid phosphatase